MPVPVGPRTQPGRVTAADVRAAQARRLEERRLEDDSSRRLAAQAHRIGQAEAQQELQQRLQRKVAAAGDMRAQLAQRSARLRAERDADGRAATAEATSLQLPQRCEEKPRRRAATASPQGRAPPDCQSSGGEYDVRLGGSRRRFPQRDSDMFAAAHQPSPRHRGRRPLEQPSRTPAGGAPFAVGDAAGPPQLRWRRPVAFSSTPFSERGSQQERRRGRARSADWTAAWKSPGRCDGEGQLRRAEEKAAELERMRRVVDHDNAVRAAEDWRLRLDGLRRKEELRRELDLQVAAKQGRQSREHAAEQAARSAAAARNGLNIGAERTDGWPMPPDRPQGRGHWRGEAEVLAQLSRECGTQPRHQRRRFSESHRLGQYEDTDEDVAALARARGRLPTRGVSEDPPYSVHDGRPEIPVGVRGRSTDRRGVRQMPQSFAHSTGAGFTELEGQSPRGDGRRCPATYSPRREAATSAPDRGPDGNPLGEPPAPAGKRKVQTHAAFNAHTMDLSVPHRHSSPQPQHCSPAPSPSASPSRPCGGKRMLGFQRTTALW
eukprot:TRINITY_DN10600_c0_g1_i1.p1 TRINITY_DN10600_c0_g1~~TRINITY_DN10600_c0_g1_i1.p1  ORF type:complete len:578 (+),score=144.93 TRINITY_DN10600_c0_g1_i1:91-1734(+)